MDGADSDVRLKGAEEHRIAEQIEPQFTNFAPFPWVAHSVLVASRCGQVLPPAPSTPDCRPRACRWNKAREDSRPVIRVKDHVRAHICRLAVENHDLAIIG